LSAVYVFGCAFRSVLPVFDGPRICLFNSWLSSVVVGRSVATCAELCFVAQWAVMLRETSRATDSVLGKIASLAVVPLIAVAEACSWYSVLTTSNLRHVAEESIWGLSAALLVTSMVVIWPRCAAAFRPVLLACCVAGAAYVAFMFLVDVPMYWSRWVADGTSGRHYMSIAQGARDVAVRRLVSYRWEDWKSEVVWMSLYFSVAVWLSIARYVMAEITVTDPEAYKQYAAAVAPIVAKLGGKYLVRGGQTVTEEGEPPSGRIVVIEFDDLAAARSFEDSPEYQAVAPLRRKAAHSRVFLVEGTAQ
jgi:uncharacterized protein (DUF1330 family)